MISQIHQWVDRSEIFELDDSLFGVFILHIDSIQNFFLFVIVIIVGVRFEIQSRHFLVTILLGLGFIDGRRQL